MKERKARFKRKSRETDVAVEINLDSGVSVKVKTTLPFLDHMLDAFAVHGGFSLKFRAAGDTHVDPHHLVEDCGIALGSAIRTALRNSPPVKRAGFFIFPMDGSVARVALDVCGRPNLVWKIKLDKKAIGGFDPALFRDFFKGLCDSLKATLHVCVEYKDNDHHAVEAIFKALGRALRDAITPTGTTKTTSSKGRIDD
jgi:imidazoleglycerol-phosphate dehydratase